MRGGSAVLLALCLQQWSLFVALLVPGGAFIVQETEKKQGFRGGIDLNTELFFSMHSWFQLLNLAVWVSQPLLFVTADCCSLPLM